MCFAPLCTTAIDYGRGNKELSWWVKVRGRPMAITHWGLFWLLSINFLATNIKYKLDQVHSVDSAMHRISGTS